MQLGPPQPGPLGRRLKETRGGPGVEVQDETQASIPAAELSVAAMIAAADGSCSRIASGSKAYPTVPLGPIILLTGAGSSLWDRGGGHPSSAWRSACS